jgi:hypothetical protein
VPGRVGEHPLELAPGVRLAGLLGCEGGLEVGRAGGEVVADALELAQGEQSRPGERRRRRPRGEARIGGCDDRGVLALEAGDLLAERPPSRPLGRL